jgi:hypothetical protein
MQIFSERTVKYLDFSAMSLKHAIEITNNVGYVACVSQCLGYVACVSHCPGSICSAAQLGSTTHWTTTVSEMCEGEQFVVTLS